MTDAFPTHLLRFPAHLVIEQSHLLKRVRARQFQVDREQALGFSGIEELAAQRTQPC